MIIKNAKVYKICLVVCVAAMVIGMILQNIRGFAELVGDAIYVTSWILGVLLGAMRLYKDMVKWSLRKKEKGVVILSLPLLFFTWFLKLWWISIVVLVGFIICLMLPAVSAPIAFFRYRNELVEA